MFQYHMTQEIKKVQIRERFGRGLRRWPCDWRLTVDEGVGIIHEDMW